MLYIDAPVGTGFSYSTTKEGAHGDDIIAAKQGYDFIRKVCLTTSWLHAGTDLDLLLGGANFKILKESSGMVSCHLIRGMVAAMYAILGVSHRGSHSLI